MAVDIAQLGIEIRSDGVLIASDRLKQLAASGKEAETSTKGLSTSFWKMSGVVAVATAAIMAFYTSFRLLKDAMKVIDDYNMSVLSIAALVTNISKNSDLAAAYKEAVPYAQNLSNKMEELDALSIMTGRDLQDMARVFIQHGIMLDTNNKKQMQSFLDISNMLAVLTAGQQGQNQAMQETQAFLDGQVNAHNRLALQIDQSIKAEGIFKEGLKEALEYLKKTGGDPLEFFSKYTKGFNAASQDIQSTWTAVSATFKTIKDQLLRTGLGDMYKDVVGILISINEWLTEHKDIIEGALRKGWLALTGIAESFVIIMERLRPIWEPILVILGKVLDIFAELCAVYLPAQIKFLDQTATLAADLVDYAWEWGKALLSVIQKAINKVEELGKAVRNAMTFGLEDKLSQWWTDFKQAPANAPTYKGFGAPTTQGGTGLVPTQTGTLLGPFGDWVSGLTKPGGALYTEQLGKAQSMGGRIKADIKGYSDIAAQLERGISDWDKKRESLQKATKIPEVTPYSGTDKEKKGKGRGITDEQLSALDDSWNKYYKALYEKDVTAAKDRAAAELDILQYSNEQGLITVSDYYKQKEVLEDSYFNMQLQALNKSIADQEKSYALTNTGMLYTKQYYSEMEKLVNLQKEKGELESKISQRNIQDAIAEIAANDKLRASINNITLQYLEQNHQYAEATKLKQQLEKLTPENMRLQTEANFGDRNAQKALEMKQKINVQDEINAKLQQDQYSYDLKELEIKHQINKIDELETNADISHGAAARERLVYYNEQLKILQTTYQYLMSQPMTSENTMALQKSLQQIDDLSKNIIKDNNVVKEQYDDMFSGFKQGYKEYLQNAMAAFQGGKKIAVDAAQGMTDAFDSYFFDLFTGKIHSLGDTITGFLEAVAKSMASVLAQMAGKGIMGGLGDLATELFGGGDNYDYSWLGIDQGTSGGGFFDFIGGLFGGHKGGLVTDYGIIPTYHSGGLNNDETLAVLLKNERILTQEQNANYERWQKNNNSENKTEVSIELINNTGTPIQTKAGSTTFDGKKYVKCVFRSIPTGVPI
jgi:hypothetical protein